MGDTRKIAVLVRDRQGEALRMAVGLTLEGDAISVFNIGGPIVKNEGNDLNVETLGDLDCGRFSINAEDADFEQLDIGQVAERILDYDHIVAY